MNIGDIRNAMLGKALRTKESLHQTLSKKVGLAVFASDSLSSVAYAGGEILLILSVAGAAWYWTAIPITVAIAGLLIIVALSYRQTIYAYPNGGGAYIVSRDNFGITAAQVAGAALLIDYVLTVAVSIASGVDQLGSMFPSLLEFKIEIALLLILLITFVNLRGVKESGSVFAVPTYFFIFMMLLLIVYGLYKAFAGTLQPLLFVPGAEDHPASSLTTLALAFLMLRAFSSGTAALTGVEAIANGITAFKAPKSKNAAITLMWDASLLMIMFLGLGILGYLVHAQPSHQEVLISQVARAVYGDGVMRFVTLLSATVILIMAANTSFADFPRLAALQAGDGFLPRQFTFRGSRLVFSWGIILLALFATLLILLFQGSVSRLIPLYAIGVFLCFTLSQAGMAKRWRRIGRMMREGTLTAEKEVRTPNGILHADKHWSGKLVLNLVGASITFVVMVIFLVTKFTGGAWLIVLLIPLLVYGFTRVHNHYVAVARILSTEGEHLTSKTKPVKSILLVGDIHRETLKLINFAESLGIPWEAVHIGVNEEKEKLLRQRWEERVGVGKLTIVRSPYRSLTKPLRSFVLKELEKTDGYIQVIMGELRTGNPATQMLHQNAHIIERLALSDLPRVVTTTVPFQLEGYNKATGVVEISESIVYPRASEGQGDEFADRSERVDLDGDGFDDSLTEVIEVDPLEGDEGVVPVDPASLGGEGEEHNV